MLVLRKSSEFRLVYEGGAKLISRSFVVFRLPNADQEARFGLTTPRKLGKAHERNRIRRRVREILRLSLHAIPTGFDYVINARRSALERPFERLTSELLVLIGAIG